MLYEIRNNIQCLAVALSLFMTQGVMIFFGIHSFGRLFAYGLLFFLIAKKCMQYKIMPAEQLLLFSSVTIGFLWEHNIVFVVMWIGIALLVSYFKSIPQQRKYFQKIFLAFFCVEVMLAIYERIIQQSIFPTYDLEELLGIFTVEAMSQAQFRATSLMGYPLANALVTSICMSFLILYYNSIKKKMIIWFMGYWALFAFNARGAIVMWVVISVLLFVNIYVNSTVRDRHSLLWRNLILIPLGLYFLMNTHWGGRLFGEEGVIDGSSMTRISAFDYYYSLSFDSIMFGYNYPYPPTENGYLNMLIRYGLFGGLLFIISQVRLVFYYVKDRTKFDKWILLLAFIGVGQTNNALTDPVYMFVFCMCIALFPPKNNENINYNTTI